MISGKVWGTTWDIFARNGVRCMGLRIDPGAHCSRHRHRYKANHFAVLYGRLLVRVWQTDYPLCDVTLLRPGDSMVVSPGKYHQFQAESEEVIAIETYWGTCDEGDIERDGCGSSGMDSAPSRS